MRSFPAPVHAGFQTHVQPGRAGASCERQRKGGLRHGLPAGQREPSAAFIEKLPVAQRELDYFFAVRLFSAFLQRAGRADFFALPAGVARCALKRVSRCAENVQLLRADLFAHAAADAALRVEEQFGFAFLRFRVMAPSAAQRTALQKHRRADAGPVVYAEALNVENQPLHPLYLVRGPQKHLFLHFGG